MSLPRFLDRVVDAAVPVLSGLDRNAVQDKLSATAVSLVGGPGCAGGARCEGFLFAANLLARLYPTVAVEGPDDLVRAAKREILNVNPHAEVEATADEVQAQLRFESAGVASADVVLAHASNWSAHIDTEIDASTDPSKVFAPAALASAALGVGEVFRAVFAAELGERGRTGAQPGSLDLLGATAGDEVPDIPAEIDLGSFRLVGAGAIGQAAAATLGATACHGRMVAIDHETVALSNLQRYVLTQDTHVGAVKVFLLRERLRERGLEVTPIEQRWHAGLVEEPLPTLVALDSAEDRIAVQASLPGPIYNAWTQPSDIGWSRHEHFGETPCLACLYWPEHEVPGRHEQIAAAFAQHPLRILGYLVHRLPVGLPLPPGAVPVLPNMAPPAEADRWIHTPLLADIAAAGNVTISALAEWEQRSLADVYQDGICGGALLGLGLGEAPPEVLVPLAHQSALAGVMLASEFLISRVPELAGARSGSVEHRLDVLAGFPQVVARPRARTAECLCADSVFREVYDARFSSAAVPSPAGELGGVA